MPKIKTPFPKINQKRTFPKVLTTSLERRKVENTKNNILVKCYPCLAQFPFIFIFTELFSFSETKNTVVNNTAAAERKGGNFEFVFPTTTTTFLCIIIHVYFHFHLKIIRCRLFYFYVQSN